MRGRRNVVDGLKKKLSYPPMILSTHALSSSQNLKHSYRTKHVHLNNKHIWPRWLLRGASVTGIYALIATNDHYKCTTHAMYSLGRISYELGYVPWDDLTSVEGSIEDRVASIFARIAQDLRFQHSVVTYGGVQVMLHALEQTERSSRFQERNVSHLLHV
jgi:hypothetical protein